MARVSRKKTPPISLSVGERIYKTALYLRLSKENSGTATSDSIEMQEYLLTRYVKSQPDLDMVAVFQDNGFTGTDFCRPDFMRMMEAVHRGEVDCIVVKDLSRFGRNYVEIGCYLEQIFPCLDVRLVAVNDDFDTKKGGDEMAVSLKNIVNALFAKDISQKTGSALRHKQEKGEFIGSWAPYGYLKSPEDKHRLIPDLETAPVIRKIFAWRLEQTGCSEIAKRLNVQQIPCSTVLRYHRGELYRKKPPDCQWSAQTIRHILANPVYIGHMVQGKQRRSLHDGIPMLPVPQTDWQIVLNTHQPLVTEQIWKQVQTDKTLLSVFQKAGEDT